jgi:hypothetical protein
MNPIYPYLFALALLAEAGVVVLLLRRTWRFERRLGSRNAAVEARLEELGQVVARLDDEGWALLSETPAEDRKKARDAERRFTEGVANILSFSGAGGGRKGEGA